MAHHTAPFRRARVAARRHVVACAQHWHRRRRSRAHRGRCATHCRRFRAGLSPTRRRGCERRRAHGREAGALASPGDAPAPRSNVGRGPLSTTATGNSSTTASGSSGTCSRRGGLPANALTATGASNSSATGLRDNPRGAGRSAFAWNDHSTAIRTFVLACAAVVAPKANWIRAALRTHAATLADPGFYVRHGNHALNQSRGLLAAGCILGRRDWQRLAADRIANAPGRERGRAGRDERAVDLLPVLQPGGLPGRGGPASRVWDDGSAVVPATRQDDRLADPRHPARTARTRPLATPVTLRPGRSVGQPPRTRPRKGARARCRRHSSRRSTPGSRSDGPGGGPPAHSRTRSCGRHGSGPGARSTVTWTTAPSRSLDTGSGWSTIPGCSR